MASEPMNSLTGLPTELLKIIFQKLSEEDRRELSRTHPKLREYYRFDSGTEFFTHIQGNSWKLFRKGVTQLLHSRPLSKNKDWPKQIKISEVKFSKFNLYDCFDTKYRSYKSIMMSKPDVKAGKDVKEQKKNSGPVELKPKPKPVEWVESLILDQCVLSSTSLYFLTTYFPNVKILVINQCGIWFSAKPIPFKGAKKLWTIEKLSITAPLISNDSEASKTIFEFIEKVSDCEVIEKHTSFKRSVARRIVANVNRELTQKKKSVQKKDVSGTSEPPEIRRFRTSDLILTYELAEPRVV